MTTETGLRAAANASPANGYARALETRPDRSNLGGDAARAEVPQTPFGESMSEARRAAQREPARPQDRPAQERAGDASSTDHPPRLAGATGNGRQRASSAATQAQAQAHDVRSKTAPRAAASNEADDASSAGDTGFPSGSPSHAAVAAPSEAAVPPREAVALPREAVAPPSEAAMPPRESVAPPTVAAAQAESVSSVPRGEATAIAAETSIAESKARGPGAAASVRPHVDAGALPFGAGTAAFLSPRLSAPAEAAPASRDSLAPRAATSQKTSADADALPEAFAQAVAPGDSPDRPGAGAGAGASAPTKREHGEPTAAGFGARLAQATAAIDAPTFAGGAAAASTSSVQVAPGTAPSGALPTALVSVPATIGQPDFAQRFATEVTVLASAGIERARIDVQPPELGPVRVELTLDGETARIAFTAARPETRQAIEQSLPVLKDMLATGGLVLGDANVSQGRPDSSREGDPGYGQAPHVPHGAGLSNRAHPGDALGRRVSAPRGTLDVYA